MRAVTYLWHRHAVLLGVIALASGCARRAPRTTGTPVSAPAPPVTSAPVPPSHVVIRVDAVQIAPRRSNGSSWDEPQAVAAKSNAGCEFLSAAAGFGVTLAYGAPAGTVAAKGMSFLCVDTTPATQVQQDSTLPDLQIALSANAEAAFLSERVDNVAQHVFRYQFLVPFAAIPPDGLKIEVLDVDAGAYENLGLIRLTRDDVLNAVNSPTRMLTRAAQDVQRIEFVLEPYAARPAGSVTMNAVMGARSAETTAIAGEVVEARAIGFYTVGSYYDAKLSPGGYPGGGPKDYNFGVEPLRSAPHGCGFAAVGNRRRGAALVAPEGRFLSPTTGPLIVGINDNDPSNNAGVVTFHYSLRAPTVDEWLARRSVP